MLNRVYIKRPNSIHNIAQILLGGLKIITKHISPYNKNQNRNRAFNTYYILKMALSTEDLYLKWLHG